MARTDGDSWDLASSVGATATMVAAQRALGHREKLIDDPYAEPLVRAVGVDLFTRMLDGDVDFTAVDPAFTPRRAAEGMAVRTRFFDEVFLDGAAAGIRQAVILAAGLDARGYRLPWPDGTVIFELDQPKVLAFKRDVVAQLGDSPRADRREVAVDLRDDWPRALVDAGFDPSVPTAWIAEGLLIYLPAAAQDQLFAGIDSLSAPGSRAAVEEGRPMPQHVFEAKQQEERDAGQEGTFFTLIYNEQIAPADEWFGARGWHATPTPLARYLTSVGRPIPADDPEAGPMAEANSLVSAVKG